MMSGWFVRISGILILLIVYGRIRRITMDTPGWPGILLGVLNLLWLICIVGLFSARNIVLSFVVAVGYPVVIAIWTTVEEKRKCEEEESRGTATETVRTTPVMENPDDISAEIRRYKELLDTGAITQEEYDVKEKQLLGLPDQNQSGISLGKKKKYLVCPDCGRTQLSSRTDCWNCKRVFKEQG